ncbi:hypothetical protein MBLNU459_g1304t1 [Dothideomycetes sp. NU459]
MFEDTPRGRAERVDIRSHHGHDELPAEWYNSKEQESRTMPIPTFCNSYLRDTASKRSNRRPIATSASHTRSLLYPLYVLIASTLPGILAQSCISLGRSTQCSAFNASSISTDSTLTGLFPFLVDVTDVASFDTQIQEYISGAFSQQRYQQLIGCSSYNTSNSTNYYARYTTSVLSRPLCADTCAEYAESEEDIAASNVCGTIGSNAMSQIRADFTNCALPADSLTGTCIEGVTNQPDNCGFSDNVGSLCSYCASSSPNATDSCCVFSKTESRCANVVLPVVATSTMQPLFTSSSASSPTGSATGSGAASTSNSRGLSGGAIAGVVIGSILGAFLLLALVIIGCVLLRRRQRDASPATSVFNQPSQGRQGPPMALIHDGAGRSQRDQIEALPGGRVARMTAIEASSSELDRNGNSPPVAGAYAKSSSDEDSPGTRPAQASAPPPKRSGSLSSGSMLGLGVAREVHSPDDTFSSPDTSQSEQLNSFKDYYSQDEIHISDLVSTLWAYQPRAADEFELERGDMLKILGIWDDGWATGVRVRMQAEDWRGEDKLQRDSGVSDSRTNTPEEHGNVKAFPLVCVCLPQHWRHTIEGETTEGETADEPPSSP